MELLVFIGALIGVLIVLDILTLRFGHDSRASIYRDDRWRRRL